MEVRDVRSVPSPLQSSRGSARAYVVALVAVTAALCARALLRPILGLSMQYSFSLLATAFTIWYCGLWPAILVALLGGLGAAILFFGPISTLGSFAAVLLYILMCGSVIAAGHVNRRTLKALQATLSLGMDYRFVIHTPLMWRDKAATWALAHRLGGDRLVELISEETHSCYLGDRTHRDDWGFGCGGCPAGELRRRGWEAYAGAGR